MLGADSIGEFVDSIAGEAGVVGEQAFEGVVHCLGGLDEGEFDLLLCGGDGLGEVEGLLRGLILGLGVGGLLWGAGGGGLLGRGLLLWLSGFGLLTLLFFVFGMQSKQLSLSFFEFGSLFINFAVFLSFHL
jgi:hypothetical protein